MGAYPGVSAYPGHYYTIIIVRLQGTVYISLPYHNPNDCTTSNIVLRVNQAEVARIWQYPDP